MTQASSLPASLAAFCGAERLAAGPSLDVVIAVARRHAAEPDAALLVFNRATGEVVDLDLRGTSEDVAKRYADVEPGAARRGRPKLGVTPREVTLLPRHWDWLARQPGGASVALRKLVEAASRADAASGRPRREAAYRFMSAIAGDLPGFEDASRALFASDRVGLSQLMGAWPPDIANEVEHLLNDPESASS